MMGVADLLASVTLPQGGPRFHPPGDHPATAQLRAQIVALRGTQASPARDQALEHHERNLARFEHVEELDRRDFIRHATGRIGEAVMGAGDLHRDPSEPRPSVPTSTVEVRP